MHFLINLIFLFRLTNCYTLNSRKTFIVHHCLYERRTNKIDNDDDNGPFKTGKHTYAMWDNNEDAVVEKENSYDEGDDVDFSDNPLVAGLRKLYNTVFFYGLGPAPKRNTKLEKEMKSNRMQASPFFTSSERYSQQIINSDSNSQTTIPKSAPSRNSSPKYNPNTQPKSKIDSDSDSNTKQAQPSMPRNNDMSIPQLRKYVSELDKRISEIMEEIEVNEVTITGSVGTRMEADITSKILPLQSSLKEELEELQIEYVTRRSTLDVLLKSSTNQIE